ncbi:peptidoglycan recognition family protein [Methanohalobium sp.]|uniref:peptidoglycan recognition protein family protein n=1 Tax=Methanohalobium sp. TaxID=2837493 RepID=UPI0025D132B6|nr:peptidoglycan recognition family protein [Methanohalobium sp.]
MLKLKPEDIRYLVVHTAAYDGENDNLEDIIRWHKEERGFSTIGYHYYIRKDGTIKKGREEQYVGAHCKASRMNFKSLGICFEGHHDYEEWTEDQKDSFKILCRSLQAKYRISDENIIGHREAYEQDPTPKTCPGKEIDMDEVRRIYPEMDADKVDVEELEEFEGKIDFSKLELTDTL